MKGNSSGLRKGRYSELGRIYLVTFVTFERKPIFNDYALGRQVVDVLHKEAEFTDTLAFVVMPDHVHWLLQLESKSLSATLKTVKSISSRKVKRIRGMSSDIWQKGFHDHAVRREEDLVNIARYIVMNPVRAGLVKSIREYPLWDAVWLQ
ncbi:transposase [Amphritea sp. 1_MG-2023]|uniref:REP-associated tyrosine transposase n=1 Tax=Amphritea sp. 1_MG-2023 TaxID=3062670 RepID=UPI0026E1DB39|nr:transposase [Amphritea sp. 1_MG-2023]MDO6562847.1 transposase [Amphritea sp. 1_MG-2023]